MHPVSFDIDYVVDRNPLTVFFRLLLAIPWFIFSYLYGVAALLATLIAWFALTFTGRFPQGMYNFASGYVRFSGRLAGWMMLATDAFPPFSGSSKPDYPVHVEVGPRQEQYSRVKTFFKIILAFPVFLLSYGAQAVAGVAAFITWWRVLFTGKQSATMHDALKLGLTYTTRANAYMLLLTEVYPMVLDVPRTEYPAEAPALPPA